MADGHDETTTIPLTKATRKRLKLWKTEKDMTYDEAINHLIVERERDDDD